MLPLKNNNLKLSLSSTPYEKKQLLAAEQISNQDKTLVTLLKRKQKTKKLGKRKTKIIVIVNIICVKKGK